VQIGIRKVSPEVQGAAERWAIIKTTTINSNTVFTKL
jgi:hypothetical protein